jgi:hypothetical protein
MPIIPDERAEWRAGDATARAPQRTLVREGALVLAPFTYEITPQFSLAHWDTIRDPFVPHGGLNTSFVTDPGQSDMVLPGPTASSLG